MVKQALDIGLHGVIFNGVDTPEQALFAVRTMRYPQMKDSKYHEPNGIRGAAPGNAMWIWGLSSEEYESHADRLAAQSRRRSVCHDDDRVGGGD